MLKKPLNEKKCHSLIALVNQLNDKGVQTPLIDL
jgi:DNA replication protein DnaC